MQSSPTISRYPPPPPPPPTPPTYPQKVKKKIKTLQHGHQPGEVSNNKYMYIFTRYARFFNACFVCISLIFFLICRPLISFTNFIKSLSLLVSFLLNFRHGLSIDRSHVHLSIYKRSFYQEFQQILMRWSFGNSLRKVGQPTSCGRNTVHNTGGSCHRPPNSPPNELHNTSCCRTIFQLNGAINK